MDLTEAYAEFKYILHDVNGEYNEQAFLYRLNSALHYTAVLLMNAGSPLLVKEADMADGEDVPSDFVRTVGLYPVALTGRTLSYIDGSTSMKVRYYAEPARITSTSGAMPFALDSLNDFVVRVAAMFALNRNEFDITQDKGLMTDFQTAAAPVLGA